MPSPPRISYSTSSELSALPAVVARCLNTVAKQYPIFFNGEQNDYMQHVDRGRCKGLDIMAPDEATFDFIRGRRYAPKAEQFEKAVKYWEDLKTDPNAKFDKSITFNVSALAPQVSWGTNPGMVVGITDTVPQPPTNFPREMGMSSKCEPGA